MGLRPSWIVATVACLAVTCGSARAAQPLQHWPSMQPFMKTVSIDMRSPKQTFTVLLPDRNNHPAYKLVCFSGNEAAVQELGIVYSGGLLCGLGAIKTPNNWILGNRSLLSDGTTGAMYSRGNFNPEEIVGTCGSYPEFGRERTFRLRGFLLNLKLSDVEISPSYSGGAGFRANFDNIDRKDFPIGRAKLTVSVAPSSADENEYAAPTKIKDPKGNQQTCMGSR